MQNLASRLLVPAVNGSLDCAATRLLHRAEGLCEFATIGVTRKHQPGSVSARSCVQRRPHAANLVRKFHEIARGEGAVFQEVEHECIDARAHRFHCVERK